MSQTINQKIGDLLLRSDETTELEPSRIYKEITVKLWGKGVILRGETTGAQIASKRRFVARQGQFILSRIDARNGALGVVPDYLDGAVVTNDFPLFNLNKDKIDAGYIGWLCKTPSFVEECQRASEGTTNRVRLQESKFLSREIPLPPLSEQRRIVARIEELAAKIEEARRLRKQTLEEVESLTRSSIEFVFDKMRSRTKPVALGSKVRIQGGYAFKSSEYEETGLPIVRITNLENETVHASGSPCMPLSRLEEFKRFVLAPNDILIAMTGATTGKLGIVPADCGTWLLNQRVGRFVPIEPESLHPKYVYWLARGVQKRVFETAYGGAQPNISPKDIEAIEFPFPSLSTQKEIVEELDYLELNASHLKLLQSETSTELDALLPSVLDKAFRGEL